MCDSDRENLDRASESRNGASPLPDEAEARAGSEAGQPSARRPSSESPNAVETPVIPRFVVFLLLAAVFAIAVCGIIYELLIGSVSSYFLGNSVEQYSLTIGFFLFAMGLGSWLSRAVRSKLIARLVMIELWLGLFGGLTVPILYLAFTYTDAYQYVMLLLVVVLGALIGLEIPLLTRILQSQGPLRTTLSNILSMDYLGALLAALLFPFFCLPLLGAFHTSLLTGGVNLLVGAAIFWATRPQIADRDRQWLIVQTGLIALALAAFAFRGTALLEKWESALYQGRIVYNEETQYQKIVVTRWKGDVRLFLNEHLQFSSVDEYRYHESLVHPALTLARDRNRVLIVGGGDGLAAREVLKYAEVEHIDLVDLDPRMTKLAKRNLNFTELNENSLSYPKVKVTNEDAFIFLQREHVPWSVVIIDLPDPREEALSKLYSVEGYKMYKRHLSPGGVLVTQATSPFYARRAYWCIGESIKQAGFAVHSYHAYVPSFGEWGFHLAAGKPLDVSEADFGVPLRFLTKELFQSMFLFDPDMSRVDVEPNHLERPRLAEYYRNDYERW